MGMKNWIAVHTYHSDEIKRKFTGAVPLEDRLTDIQWAKGWRFEKARCRQYWIGNDDFFFCNWEAESESDIHDALEHRGMSAFCQTACYQIHDHVDANQLTGALRKHGPWED